MEKYPRISAHKFQSINSGLTMHYPQPWKWNKDFDYIILEKGWKIIGWCYNRNLPDYRRINRDPDDIAVMFESPSGEDVWFHSIKEVLNTQI